ncbi:MAG: hypothetical protein KatS3mg113_0504 [Planctomycetaceae bacterium]|nr:MAG: hypothetical protein KatS3mg113_0504 [Planctomycetaceae bacterium]
MFRMSTLSAVHLLAKITMLLALLPISVGALVTSLDAGMAFADWPTSDGQGMLQYPWLQAQGDKFWEHGHRLAGMLIGLATLCLAVVVWMAETPGSIRVTTTAVLAGVVVQGILGGQRVLFDERWLALIHGMFAAIVFGGMCWLVWQTSPEGRSAEERSTAVLPVSVWWLSSCTLLLLGIQYMLGGLLRHLGFAVAWLIHPWLAWGVWACAALLWWQARPVCDPALQRTTRRLCLLLLLQIALGWFAWRYHFGLPEWSLVALPGGREDIAFRSLHKVTGLLTFAAASVCWMHATRLLGASSAWGGKDLKPRVLIRLTGGAG